MLASVAPLAASGLVWAVTGSALALVFGALGPVTAVATMLDARRINRRTARRDAMTWTSARDALRTAIADRHAAARKAAWSETPAAATIIGGAADDARWRPGTGAHVALGSGSVPSDVVIDGELIDTEDRELVEQAGRLDGAPVVADAAGGIGIAGPVIVARAAARAVVVQLAHARSPADTALHPAPGWEWMRDLPHPAPGQDEPHTITVSEGAEGAAAVSHEPGTLLVAIAEEPTRLPPACATVVRLADGAHAEVVRSPVHARGLRFVPELVAEAEAARFASASASAALRAGLGRRGTSLPGFVALSDLRSMVSSPEDPRDMATLRCPIGIGTDGQLLVDLVRDGPHAIVAGTTGSGKSELLVTWVASMARLYPPGHLTVLLVDFKGGAAFSPLGGLPHCVGLITDLDETEAARALSSLRAELRHRERILRDAGARDITDMAGRLPRLVIVVDEFQAMLDAFPALHALFVDLAARGRSLGIHVILCTQRPAGAVRDALLGNCSLRVSLRVNNSADSVAVLGTDAAAGLSPTLPGRALVQTADGIRACQVATTTQNDLDGAAARWSGSEAPRRPWLDPLPHVLTREQVALLAPEPSPPLVLGLLDEPERQRYTVAAWNPEQDGHVLVVGDPGAGKSTLLRRLALGSGSGTHPAAGVEGIWDALHAARDLLDGSSPAAAGEVAADRTLLLLDDLDAVFPRWEPDYQLAALETLTVLLRDGPAAGIRLGIAMQRLAGPLRQLVTLCPARLLLRMADRDEYRACGGVDRLFDSGLPPGGGVWAGSRIQLVWDGLVGDELVGDDVVPGDPGPVAPSVLPAAGHLVLIAGVPSRAAAAVEEVATRIGRPVTVVDVGGPIDTGGRTTQAGDAGQLTVDAGDALTVFVGDPASWQRQWTLLSALRRDAPVIFDRCSVADFRLVTGSRTLPPPLAPGSGHCWQLTPDGDVRRIPLLG